MTRQKKGTVTKKNTLKKLVYIYLYNLYLYGNFFFFKKSVQNLLMLPSQLSVEILSQPFLLPLKRPGTHNVPMGRHIRNTPLSLLYVSAFLFGPSRDLVVILVGLPPPRFLFAVQAPKRAL